MLSAVGREGVFETRLYRGAVGLRRCCDLTNLKLFESRWHLMLWTHAGIGLSEREEVNSGVRAIFYLAKHCFYFSKLRAFGLVLSHFINKPK